MYVILQYLSSMTLRLGFIISFIVTLPVMAISLAWKKIKSRAEVKLARYFVPSPGRVEVPLDTNTVDGRGYWPVELKPGRCFTLKKKKGKTMPYVPSVPDVLEVRDIIKTRGYASLGIKGVDMHGKPVFNIDPTKEKVTELPIEIVDIIMDMAEYWACTKTVVSRTMVINGIQTLWRRKERDWEDQLPGSCIRPNDHLMTSEFLKRTIPNDSETHGIYLRSWPVGYYPEIIHPKEINPNAHFVPTPEGIRVKLRPNLKTMIHKAIKMLKRGIEILVGFIFKEREELKALREKSKAAYKKSVWYSTLKARWLSGQEVADWNIETRDLVPNRDNRFVSEDERKTRKLNLFQWRHYFSSMNYSAAAIQNFKGFRMGRKERLRCEEIVYPAPGLNFLDRYEVAPRILEAPGTKEHCVRRMVWRIWTKSESQISSCDPVWLEMYTEEKNTYDKNWYRRYPNTQNSNILVQRVLTLRPANANQPQLHTITWDFDDYIDEKAEAIIVNGVTALPKPVYTPPHVTTLAMTYAQPTRLKISLPLMKPLFWGQEVPKSVFSPLSRPFPALPPMWSETIPEPRDFSLTRNTISEHILSWYEHHRRIYPYHHPSPFPAAHRPTPPNLSKVPFMQEIVQDRNAALMEDPVKGNLMKNRALAREVIGKIRKGDRVVLVVRAEDWRAWNNTGQQSARNTGREIDCEILRAELEVYWAV